MISDREYKELVNKYPECEEPLRLHMDWEYEQAFQKLISLKDRIPEALYGCILTKMYIMDTDEVDIETLKKAFAGVSREALMCDEDIEKYKAMPEIITIYRGTQDPSERMPRLSWSLKKEVARNFGPSHIFKTSIPKDAVIAYYSKDGDEEEILATVTDNFEII